MIRRTGWDYALGGRRLFTLGFCMVLALMALPVGQAHAFPSATLTFTATPNPVAPGGRLTYTAVIVNSGSEVIRAAYFETIVDTGTQKLVPRSVTTTRGVGTLRDVFGETNNEVFVALGKLERGATVTITFAAVIQPTASPSFNVIASLLNIDAQGLQNTIVDGEVDITVQAPKLLRQFALPTPSAEPWSITRGLDGNFWFTEFSANQIGRITPAGAITEFPLPGANSSPSDITVGPDGALWFAETSGKKIGRSTTSGIITEFTIPATDNLPNNITAGPDGNLWFTAFPNMVWRLTPAGAFTPFTPPTANSNPHGITVGPDGALWFSEQDGNHLGRITTAGQITEVGIVLGPNNITTGPDGNLWVTEQFQQRIARVTPAGVVTEFVPPTPDSVPTDITTGPDGNLWFTEFNANMVARITPAGVITEFPSGRNSGPFGITAGFDRTIWFTELRGNKIGARRVP